MPDTETEPNIETPAGQELPQDTPETPETPPVPPEETPAPQAPAVDPMVAELRETNARLLEHVLRPQQAPAQPQAEQEVDIEKFIEDNMGEKSAPVLKQLVKHLEKKLGKRFADRSEFEQTKAAAMQAATRAQEQEAISEQKEDGVPDDVLTDAKKLILDWAKQGEFYPSAKAAYRAAVGEVVKQKMYGLAAKERAKKEAVKAKQSNATAPKSEPPSLPEGVPKRAKGESFEAYAARLNKVEFE